MSLNKAIIIGRLSKDIELAHTSSGTACANFSVATDGSYKDKQGNKKEVVDWHNLVCYGRMAENCNQYLRKGSTIYAEGSMKTRSWEKDGVKKYKTEIMVTNIQFLDGKKQDNNDQAGNY